MTDTMIKFGKHKGCDLDEIAFIDPKYLLFLLTNIELLKPHQYLYIIEKLIGAIKLGFGKYADKTFNELRRTDPKYLQWMAAKTKHVWVTRFLQ
jgi:hypothetical protein